MSTSPIGSEEAPAHAGAVQMAELAPDESPYFNRELSWLQFNQRVLAEACNPAYPLLERLRFLSISGSNLDEFMMIRVAGLVGQVQRGMAIPSIDGRSPSQQLAAIREKLVELSGIQQSIWRSVREGLAGADIYIADEQRVSPAAHKWLKAFFLNEILPIITPQALDPAHPFPFVQNEGMGLLFTLTRDATSEQLIEMVLIPSALPRFVRVPDEVTGDGGALYISIARLIQRYAQKVGLDPAAVAAHSLRSGFLTEAAKAGASLPKMQEVSRQKKVEVLLGYVRDAALFENHAGERFL